MSSFIERPRTSCALGGALVTIGALPRVVAISHTALGCAGNLSGAISTGAGYFGSGYCSGQSTPTSGVTETEIVFGGFDRLVEQIQSTQELIDADLFVVATGCMTEMIGDDVQGAVSECQDFNIPVIAISTPSFKGDAYNGYEIVLEGIFNKFLRPSEEKNQKLVNLFGIIPGYDPFFRGNLEEMKRILNRVGIEVNTFFTPDQNYENLKASPKAALNINFSRVYGIDFVKNFERRHDVPYLVTDLPIGAEATDIFLREIGEKLGLDHDLIEKVIQEENAIYFNYIERTADVFADGEYKFYVSLVTNANELIPYASFLERELGWVTSDLYITNILSEEQKEILTSAFKLKEFIGELLFETDTSKIEEGITKRHKRYGGEIYFDDENSPLFILGSRLEKDLSLKRGINYLPVSFPVQNRIIVDRGYAGYRGGLHLLEDIVDVLVSQK